MDELINDGAPTGSYCVRTESGTAHIVDVEEDGRRYIQRIRAEHAMTERFLHVPISILRRDGERIPLLHIERLRVGERGAMIVDVRGDGILTFRGTTPILSITRLSEERPHS